MFCPKCGKKISDDSVYCLACSTKIVRPPKTSVEAESVVTQKEIDKSSTGSFNPYKGLIICAVIVILAALILPLYYYEGGTKHSFCLLDFKEINRDFGRAFRIPLTRCHAITFACLALTSMITIVLAYKKKHKGIMFCFFVALCTMVIYPIYMYDNLPDLNTIRTVSIGFFVIIIAIVVGMIFSYKCSNYVNS